MFRGRVVEATTIRLAMLAFIWYATAPNHAILVVPYQ